MADFVFRYGDPVLVPYTPSGGPVLAGAGVVLGSVTANTAGVGAVQAIAHNAIANSVQGSVAVGGGVYDAMVASNYAAGVKLYKPAASAILTTTGTNNTQFGYLMEAASAANAVCKVLHKPYP